MLNIISHQGNANQKQMRYHFTLISMTIIKTMENNEIKETKKGTRKPRAKRATAAEGDENAIFIGTLIQQELKNQERTVSW